MAITDYKDFKFPDFNIQGFPYQNILDQLNASMQMPTGGTYRRFAQHNSGGASNAGTGQSTNGGALSIPNFPAFNPGQPNFTPGLHSVAPAGANGGLLGTNTTLPNNGISPAGTSPVGQARAAVRDPQMSFSNNLGIDPNNLPAMLGGGQATTPQAQWFANAYNAMNPTLNYSAQTVQNALNGGRPDLAYLMIAQAGKGLQDASGVSPEQINDAFYNHGGATLRFDPATIALLRSLGAT